MYIPWEVLCLLILVLSCASHCCCCRTHEDRNPGPSIPAAAKALLVVLLLAGVGVVTLLYGPFELLLLCGLLLIPATCVLLVCVILSIVRAYRKYRPAKPLALPALPPTILHGRVSAPTPSYRPGRLAHALTNGALVVGVTTAAVLFGTILYQTITALSG